jgi:hypothetical protein
VAHQRLCLQFPPLLRDLLQVGEEIGVGLVPRVVGGLAREETLRVPLLSSG